jgi:Arc/MetJ family transcription regulator
MLIVICFYVMRTTVDISDELLRQAKKRATDEGTALREVVETALRLYLQSRPRHGRYRLRWRTEKGRILPNVRLDDRDALFDLMEGRL